MLQLNQVEKHYGDKQVLQIPSYTFDKGVYWITGANGSGKTTLLKILAGLLPFRGDVLINNTSISKRPVDYRRMVSYAAAEPLYPAFLTGKDLLSFYQGIRKAGDDQVKQLLEFSGLEQFINNPVGTYSNGMIKRLSLLLAFIGHVPLIILDEPLATLDIEAAQALPEIIDTYRQLYDCSFIFSSHQPFLPYSAIHQQFQLSNHSLYPAA